MPPIEPMTLADQLSSSDDALERNRTTVAALFPEAVSEGKIDFEVLRELLGDALATGDERYGLTWTGKRASRRLALTPSLGTLLPAENESVNWRETRNLFIEGDNLEVLKLLQKSYAKKIKLIYIDPPYNTGNDLLYPNDYSQDVNTYLEITSQKDGASQLISNPESNGRWHSNWLDLIYPRLLAAKVLLRDDGVLVCTIDDNEVTNLGAILREIFGEGAYEFVCVTIVHNPRGVQGLNFSATHEYAYFVYPKGIKAIADRRIAQEDVAWTQFRNWGTESERSDARNCFYPVIVEDGDVVGFGDVPPNDFHPSAQTETDGRRKLIWPIDRNGIERKWRYARQSVDAVHSMLRARESDAGYEIEIGKTFGAQRTVWTDKRYDANINGSQVVKDLVPDSPFLFPKSIWAVYDVLAAVLTEPGDIVLDYFAGSGTTGHAMMQLCKVDGIPRRFILVQLPEPIKDHERFKTIADLTKERLRSAAARLRGEGLSGDFDGGFRVYKLANSNLKVWQPGADLENDLLAAADNLIPGRTDEDLLVELLLKRGIDLVEPEQTRTIAGRTVHALGGGVLVVCLADVSAKDAEALADGIAEWVIELDPVAPAVAIFKDSGFENDVAKANVDAILRQRLRDRGSDQPHLLDQVRSV